MTTMTPTRTIKAAADMRNSCIVVRILPSAETGSIDSLYLARCRYRPSPFPRFQVGVQHLRNGGGVGFRRRGKHFANCIRDSGKRDTAVEEGLDGHFVGGIEGDAVGSAAGRSLEGKAKTGKAIEIGLLEFKMAQRCEVECERGGRPLRPGQCIENGQAH